MIKFIVFFAIAFIYVVIAKLTSYDMAILAAVTTVVLFEIDRMIDE